MLKWQMSGKINEGEKLNMDNPHAIIAVYAGIAANVAILLHSNGICTAFFTPRLQHICSTVYNHAAFAAYAAIILQMYAGNLLQ